MNFPDFEGWIYTFSYENASTGAIDTITVYADDREEAEEMAFQRVMTVAVKGSLELIDTDEPEPIDRTPEPPRQWEL